MLILDSWFFGWGGDFDQVVGQDPVSGPGPVPSARSIRVRPRSMSLFVGVGLGAATRCAMSPVPRNAVVVLVTGNCVRLSTARCGARRALTRTFSASAAACPARSASVPVIRSVVRSTAPGVWIRRLVTAIWVIALASGPHPLRTATTSHRYVASGVDGRPNRMGTNGPKDTAGVPPDPVVVIVPPKDPDPPGRYRETRCAAAPEPPASRCFRPVRGRLRRVCRSSIPVP